MSKPLTIESAAAKINANMQPVQDFDGAANAKPSAQQPTPKPLPGPLERALGINQPRRVPR